MKDANVHINPARFWLLLVPLALIIAGLVVVESFEAAGSEEPRSVTYSNGTLHLAIPYHANDSGTGQLTMEVLDPEDQILGRAQRHVDAARGTGLWREDIKLKKSVSLDELVWHRLRYRFEYSDGKRAAIEGVDSISQILRTPVLHILGQQSYLTGGQAAVRVIVTDSKNEVIAGRALYRSNCWCPIRNPACFSAVNSIMQGLLKRSSGFPPDWLAAISCATLWTRPSVRQNLRSRFGWKTRYRFF